MVMMKNKECFFVLYCLFYFFCSCKSNNIKQDLYSLKPRPFYIEGNIDSIVEIKLLLYNKNSKFDSLVATINTLADGIHYNPVSNLTRFFVREVDYHYDFILIFNDMEHKFSSIEIKERQSPSFNYYEIYKYKYNDSIILDPTSFLLKDF